MSVMDIKDVCDADFGERTIHHLRQTMPDGIPAAEELEYAREARTESAEEMLNEIHCMLLHLTKDARS